MSTAHHIAGWIAVGLTAGLLIAAAWSWVAARRTGGITDHRFAVDRLVLGLLGVVIVAAFVGLVLVAGESRPHDPLHLLYGVLAALAVPVAWALGGRATAGGAPARMRRDGWLAVAAAVMLGIELRLFLTA
jgi:hypothetical protein